MSPEEAFDFTREVFPFEDYIQKVNKETYLDICRTTLRYLKPGSTILDFGAGPCDKTAMLQKLGYACSSYDDLNDFWHKKSDNREKILNFAREIGIDFTISTGGHLPYTKESFNMVMLHDVLEHLHDSPRDLLNDLLEFVKPEGLLFVTVPNAVNIRKRLHVLMGKTNHPRFDYYYWYPNPWREHVREYVKSDLQTLSKFLNLKVLELKGFDQMREKIPPPVRPVYAAITSVFDSFKDSWLLVAKKIKGWVPDKTGKIIQ